MRLIWRIHPVAVLATTLGLLVVLSCTSDPAADDEANASRAVCEDAVGDQAGIGTDRLAPGQDEPWEGGDIERVTLTVDDDTLVTEWTMVHEIATDLTDDVSAMWLIAPDKGGGLWIWAGDGPDDYEDPAQFRAVTDTPVDIPVEVEGRRLVARWPLELLDEEEAPSSWEAYTRQLSPPGYLAEISLEDHCPGTLEQANESSSPIPWPIG